MLGPSDRLANSYLSQMALDGPHSQAVAPPRNASHPRFLPLRWLRRSIGAAEPSTGAEGLDVKGASDQGGGETDEDEHDEMHELSSTLPHRPAREVVPGLPRAQTFKRQQSEVRNRLEPYQPTQAERRAVSMDRRGPDSITSSQYQADPRASAPTFAHSALNASEMLQSPTSDGANDANRPMSWHLEGLDSRPPHHELPSSISNLNRPFDTHSITTSQFDEDIRHDLEKIWILNLSMHFRDKSRREKFFVTYCQPNGRPGGIWRRVTISVDYRDPPAGSLEEELEGMHYQRDKSAKIYEAIRDSLRDIQFYDTVTNLKLETKDARLHVHVVEDVNEIINYPTVSMIEHLRCARIRESDVKFDCHMSGFVYKVQVSGETLIKKEIPGPDTVEEFLYEINALDRLRHSHSVIEFYGVIVDDFDEKVKGLLISYAERGALIDVIYDGHKALPWDLREKWARQIVQGLSEIHEFGFVQGDFTLSNIVIDRDNNAKIIDINRRGCPVGWEPPEATPLIQGNQRISMYIGIKSDLFQLGMVLWGLAKQDDEPESIQRPLPPLPDEIPVWYRDIVRHCLSHDPRQRIQAVSLLRRFPYVKEASDAYHPHPVTSVSVDSVQGYFDNDFSDMRPHIRTIQPADSAFDVDQSRSFSNGATSVGDNSAFHAKTYQQRGRSPPSPLPSNYGQYDPASYRQRYARASWSYTSQYGNGYAVGPASDIAPDELPERQSLTPQTSRDYIGDHDDPPDLSKPLVKEWIEPTMVRVAGDEPSLENETPQIQKRQQLDERASEGVAISAEEAKDEFRETDLQSSARSSAHIAAPNNERQNDEAHPETTASEVDPHKQTLNTSQDASTASANDDFGPKQTLDPDSITQEGLPAPAPNTKQAEVPGTDFIGRPDTISQLSTGQHNTPTDRYSSALTGVGSAYDEAGPDRKVSIDDDFNVPTTIPAQVSQSTDV